MSTAKHSRLGALLAAGTVSTLLLAGCASSNPLEDDNPAGGESSRENDDTTIVVGSQEYYSNEIIAEIYAQALEDAGFDVEREFSIGQRDAYMPAIEDGDITVFPEYTGNLLEYFDPSATATAPDEVYAALQEVLPEGLTVLEYAPATDQDTYTVTTEFADQYDLTTIADLAEVDVALTIGAAPEFEERPYGPAGAKETYGVDVAFSATGPTTLEDLLAGTVNIADIYSADPAFETEDIVALEDPENLILASNVVPLVQADIADEIADVLNAVSAALTPEALVALNVQSTVDQESTEDIAEAWLEENGLN
ncbi:ABC transporter substrate-binding protein [Microbacterium lushaniae]|nr:ABC transporter substrate-binding protein [Microbacterium lushaniae]KAA9154369.1 ABC transporter substrate-binding protein [Microbacterium lushaniae]